MCSKARLTTRTRENSPRGGGDTSFSTIKRAHTLSLVLSLLLPPPGWLEFFFFLFSRGEERDRETETETEREFYEATLLGKKKRIKKNKRKKKVLIEWKSCHTLRVLAPHALAFKHTHTHTHTHTHISRTRASVRFYISFLLSLFLSRVLGETLLTRRETQHQKKKRRKIEKKNHCDGGEENDDDDSSAARSSTFFFVFFSVGREKTRIRFFLPRVRRARFIGASREATRAAIRFFFL